MSGAGQAFRAAWLTIDRRSLGLFRVLFASLLATDALRRLPGGLIWLTDDGVLGKRPGLCPLTGLVGPLGTHGGAVAAVLVCAAVALWLGLGFRTKAAQIAVLLCALSLHNRDILVERSGEKVLDLMALWTLVLPLGDRFSIDALRRRAPDGPARSSAVMAVWLQLGGIYFLSGILKDGATWRDGTAIHYMLWRADVVTPLGVALREHLPLGLSQALSWATRTIELLLPVLILLPVRVTAARRVAIALTVFLHLGIALVVDLGIYQPTMLACSALLLTAPDWKWLAGWRLPRRIVDGARRLGERLFGAPRPALAEAPRWVRIATCAVLGILAAGSVSLALNQNEGLTRLHHRPIPLLDQGLACAGLPQAWARFAPDVPTAFRMLVVDGTTTDGRHVDPLNRQALGWQGEPFTTPPARLGYDTFWHNYLRLIGTPAMNWAMPTLERWIAHYPDRTGNEADRLTGYTIFVVVSHAPPPGAPQGAVQRYPLVSRAQKAQ